MIDFREIANGETWELFARDFLSELGFSVAEPPDRGADAGRDLLMVEHLRGPLGNYDFMWLVSCKHNVRAKRQPAVGVDDEPDIIERVRGFGAQGFIGVYSTIASSGLGRRLSQLRSRGQVAEYRVLDHKVIENRLLMSCESHLIARYFPKSYRRIRPLQALGTKYDPLPCVVCGKDLLEDMYRRRDMSLVQFAETTANGKRRVVGVYWSCKGRCGQAVERRLGDTYAGWRGLEDLTIPALYLANVFALLNRMHTGEMYSDKAIAQQKTLLMALGQKVFRIMTDEDRRRTSNSLMLLELGL